MNKTKDYSIFKILPHNRKLCEAHVKKLTESMSKINMLDLRPILVSKDMEVVDGQHRLAAAERLGIEVFYQVKHDYVPSDLMNLNVALAWGYEDYLNHHANLGKQDYIDIRDIMKRFNLQISTVVDLASGGQQGKKNFKNGTLKFSHKKEELILTLGNYIELTETIKSLLPPQRRYYLTHKTFNLVLINLLKNENIDVELFKKKIISNVDKIRPASRACDYLQMLEDIYNYRVPGNHRLDFSSL